MRQGQIGMLVSQKPLARRAILEEAAGISGLHQRRHEAELRLKAAETNMGRLDDIGADGLTLLREIMDIYKAYDYPTQVLAASLRHPLHVIEAARMGAHIGTMPYKVFEMLFKHPLTDRGLEGFLKDWEKARETLGDVFESASARNPKR